MACPSFSGSSPGYAGHVRDQFTRHAADFAATPELHNDAVLQLIVEAASPCLTDFVLDVACGPGSVALAFARRVARVDGLDATDAMLDQACSASVNNVNWRIASVYDLPYPDGSLDVVSSRLAFHHFEDPQAAFSEIVRVAAPSARIVLCDAVASDDAPKAQAFNEMERWRDPSTVEFRTLGYLLELFQSRRLDVAVHSRF